MKAMSNNKFAEAVLQMAELDEPFRPQATYIPEGDCLEFLVAPDDYYAERVDGLLTVYYSRESGEIIGSLIKGVKGFIAKKFPGFMIEVEAGPVKLSHLFQFQLWSEQREPDDIVVRTYRKLIEVADKVGAMAELCAA